MEGHVYKCKSWTSLNFCICAGPFMRHLCFIDAYKIYARVISIHFLKELVEKICSRIEAFSVKLSFYLSLHLCS